MLQWWNLHPQWFNIYDLRYKDNSFNRFFCFFFTHFIGNLFYWFTQKNASFPFRFFACSETFFERLLLTVRLKGKHRFANVAIGQEINCSFTDKPWKRRCECAIKVFLKRFFKQFARYNRHCCWNHVKCSNIQNARTKWCEIVPK